MVRTHDASHEYQAAYRDLVHAFFLRYPNPLATHVLSVDVLGRTIEKRHLHRLPEDAPSTDASSVASSSSSSASALRAPAEQYVLRTTRLILKRGTLPAWAPKGIMKNAESWVLEESEVELEPYSIGAASAAKGGLEALEAAKRADDEEAARRLNPTWAAPWDGTKGKGKAREPPALHVGLRGREMRSWTRNLDHTNVMAVTESMRLHERPSAVAHWLSQGGQAGSFERPTKVSSSSSAEPDSRAASAAGAQEAGGEGTTHCSTTAHITSSVALSLLARRIEKFGLNRYLAHVDTSRQGLTWTHSALVASRHPSLHPPSSTTTDPSGLLVPTEPKRTRLYAALRPPFLDGDFQGPVARLRKRWEGVREWWAGLKRGGSAAIEERIRGLHIGQAQGEEGARRRGQGA